MKISLEWLGDFLPGPLDPQTCADALTHAGFPVEAIETVGEETVLDVEVTSNRGDCLSHVGVARELSAALNLPLNTAPWARTPDQPVSDRMKLSDGSTFKLRIDAPDLCPHYTARILRGVKMGPSPDWMVRRLQAVGVRAISNIVDVTNYVLFELGQPLHAFDLARLQGPEIVVRRAAKGETLTSIDGHERALTPDMLVIADAHRPVALAGVMGGLETEVSDSTRDILLESARFDPLSVRTTARALSMGSDSSYRFERGIDPTLPARASQRAAELILQIAGGQAVNGPLAAGEDGYVPRTLILRYAKLRQVLGIDLDPKQVIDALQRLELSPQALEDGVRVTVPSWRLDLNLEIDLVEEVARIVGYDKIPVRRDISIQLTSPRPEHRTIETLRSALVSAGYHEAVTFSFVSDALADEFTPPEARALARTDPRVRSVDAQLRPSLLPGLLEAVHRNENAGNLDARLFEIGATFWHASDGRIDERRRVALTGDSDLRALRGAVEHLLVTFDADRPVRVIPRKIKGFDPSAAGDLQWGDQTIGRIGMIDSTIISKLSLRRPVAAAEIELPPLLAGHRHIPQLRPLPRFPAVRRDLSLVVSESTRYQQLESLVQDLDLPDLEAVEHAATYRGKPLEKGTKSVTLTFVFRSPTQTLQSEQIESAVARVVQAAADQLNATVRA